MRIDEVLRRLEPLPEVLPDGPMALMPVFADTGGPRPRPAWDAANGSARPAAVLVLLFPDAAGEAHLVLTERADRGGHHSGEVSFPGGRAEPGDSDIVATALREAAEEVGLDVVAAGVRVLGTLPTQWIPVSNFTVTPVVAVAERRPVMTPQPTEVAAILEAPVRAFLPDGELLHVEREIRGWQIRYAAYPIDGLAVWGMTARVLGGLGAHLAGGAQTIDQVPLVQEDVVTRTKETRHEEPIEERSEERSEEPFEAVAPDAVLRGRLTLPSGSRPVPALVVAHGAAFGLGASPIYTGLLEPALGEGVAVLRYDRRGEGESTGRPDDATLDDLAEDLLACARVLRGNPRIRSDRVGLWGISQGGWLAALAAAEDPGIAGIVAVSASGTGPAEQMEYAVATTMRAAGYDDRAVGAALSARRAVGRWEDGLSDMTEAQAVINSVRGEPWFPLAYLDDPDEDTRAVGRAWSQFDVRPALPRISVPVLLFLGDRDRWVDTVRSREIWKEGLVNAALTSVTLQGAGHMPTLATDPDSIDVEESGPLHPDYVTRLREWVGSVLLA